VPGSNKATLTLANGTVIVLEDEKNGVLSQQGNAKILKLNSGQLAYNTARQPAAGSPAAFNTLSTPRGGQYQLTLADGTVVWLNAASSITFPAAFSGKERSVTLSGEAYFEIAANASQPFIVKVGNMQVKVLGTHFNVMAYGDEQTMNTTLLEGAVKVAGATGEVLLQPGQQVKMDHAGALRVVAANLDEVIAWKNGIFSFNNAGIEEVMRQIARWYDAEVVYPDGIPQDRFQGEINRNADISTVLKILETSGVKFTVRGHKILVQP
jgi:ferric-dicitrate binding protein FerR (iron transport regulator)